MTMQIQKKQVQHYIPNLTYDYLLVLSGTRYDTISTSYRSNVLVHNDTRGYLVNVPGKRMIAGTYVPAGPPCCTVWT